MTMFELKKPESSLWVDPKSVDAIGFGKDDICYVYVRGNTIRVSSEDGNKLLEIINGKPETVAPVNTQVRAIVSIECRKTYSESTQQYFKFWTCVLDNGDKVNIFDHPDESRNTFQICERRGWGFLDAWQVDDYDTYTTCIPVVLSYDGKWYSLVDIIEFETWVELERHYNKQHIPEADMNNIPWDYETQDATENLKSGISFDDDNEDVDPMDGYPGDDYPDGYLDGSESEGNG